MTILLSLGLAAASDDTRVLQMRESYITAIMGIVFIVSSMMKKPILWLLARHQAKSEEHRTALEQPFQKKMLGTVNAVWGWSFILEFAAKLWMIENLPISRVLTLSPIMFYGVTAVTFLWTLWWLRRQTRKAAEAENARRMTAIVSGEQQPDLHPEPGLSHSQQLSKPIAQGAQNLSPEVILEGLSCQDFLDFVFGIQTQRLGSPGRVYLDLGRVRY